MKHSSKEAIEILAVKFDRPVSTVESLFEESVAAIKEEATVPTYVNVVALNLVRRALTDFERKEMEMSAHTTADFHN